MADTKLSALTAITALDDADLLLTTDTSATESKKITRANFVTDMAQTTQTLTNKTFDADGTGNSITNIENADIKAAAGIAVNKLAALTASEIAISDGSGFLTSAAVATYPSLTELTYLKGVSSAIQTQLNAKGVGDALTSNGLDQFAATTSLELLGTISDETGTGSLVFATSPTLVTPILGTPTSGNLANCTGAVVEGTAVVSTGETGGTKFLREDGDGTSSWQTIAGGGDALVANPLSQFAATTSLQLLNTISDETGTGSLVFATSPTLVTPALGTPSALVGTNITGTASGLTAGAVTNGVYTTDNLSVMASTTSAQLAGVISNETGSGALVFGTSPAITTPTGIVKGDVGLGNVDNTSDANKPVSTATQTALDEQEEVIQLAVSDETTALTTGTAKLTFRMPYAMTLTDVRASVGTAPTGAALVVDINETATTILSTKLTIDVSEKTSTTAATAPVISDSALADDAEITIDIDTVGSTIAGAGLKVTLIGTRA